MELKKRYPRVLSSGANNTVIALNDKEVGKLFVGDTRSDIGTEKRLRLIDTGISTLQKQVGDRLFERYVKQELEELERFKIYFLNR